MAENGEEVAEAVTAALNELGDLERDFATVELDALRQKEYSLKELYEKRQTLLERIPEFWATILPEGPEEFQDILAPIDVDILNTIKSMKIERYQITSERDGEPRSLRFTFDFEDNDYFEDKTVVKDFEFIPHEEGGSFVSKPVTFKWKKEGKNLGLHKLLDLVVDLYKAEQALVENGKIESAERKNLWQYEKLREAVEKSEEDENDEGSFLNWFGYRGAVDVTEKPPSEEDDDDDDDNELESDDEDDGMLDVEIFPAGEEIAITLAEDFWPNVMDYFIQATTEPFDMEDIEGEEAENGAPELVEAAEFDGFEEDEEDDAATEDRPAKKQRKA